MAGCTSLEQVVLGEKVEIIDGVFCNTINKITVTPADAKKLIARGAKTVTLGPKVKKIAAKAFAKTSVVTVILKSAKLKKKTVKNAFKGSKIKTVKVQVKQIKTTKNLKGTI